MKTVISFIIFFFLFIGIGYSQDSCIGGIITQNSMSKLLVEVEQLRIKNEELTRELDNVTSQLNEASKQVILYQNTDVLKDQIIALKDQIITLQDKQIAAGNKAFEDAMKHGEMIQKSYQQLIKDIKPSPFMETIYTILKIGGGIGIGYVFK